MTTSAPATSGSSRRWSPPSWSDPAVADAVRELLGRWFRLLAGVARRAAERGTRLGPFSPEEVGTLMALPFVGAEPMLLLGFPEDEVPARSALRKIGQLIRAAEEGGSIGDGSPA